MCRMRFAGWLQVLGCAGGALFDEQAPRRAHRALTLEHLRELQCPGAAQWAWRKESFNNTHR